MITVAKEFDEKKETKWKGMPYIHRWALENFRKGKEKEKQEAKALATGLDIRCLQQNQEQAQIVRTNIMITACRPVLRHFFDTIKYDSVLV